MIPLMYAGVAQLVEHYLAKVDVASSNLVSRSNVRYLWSTANPAAVRGFILLWTRRVFRFRLGLVELVGHLLSNNVMGVLLRPQPRFQVGICIPP